jgi:hypothetical protein
MVRPKSSSIALLSLSLLLATAACSGSNEQQLLSNYFRAARMRDNGTLGNIATVSFSPTDDGIVDSFEIVKTGDEQRRPLRLREMAATEQDARKSEEEFSKKKKEYQDANRDAIDRVLEAEREGRKLRGKDLEVQTAWTKWRDDTSTYVKKVGEARRSLAGERVIAELSARDARNQVDVTQYDGELITKDSVIRAQLRKGDGAPVQQDLNIRTERVVLKNGPESRREVDGRWIITQITPAGGGAPPTE